MIGKWSQTLDIPFTYQNGIKEIRPAFCMSQHWLNGKVLSQRPWSLFTGETYMCVIRRKGERGINLFRETTASLPIAAVLQWGAAILLTAVRLDLYQCIVITHLMLTVVLRCRSFKQNSNVHLHCSWLQTYHCISKKGAGTVHCSVHCEALAAILK